MDEDEKNMIRGLFMRKIKDFAEDALKQQQMTLYQRLKNSATGPNQEESMN